MPCAERTVILDLGLHFFFVLWVSENTEHFDQSLPEKPIALIFLSLEYSVHLSNHRNKINPIAAFCVFFLALPLANSNSDKKNPCWTKNILFCPQTIRIIIWHVKSEARRERAHLSHSGLWSPYAPLHSASLPHGFRTCTKAWPSHSDARWNIRVTGRFLWPICHAHALSICWSFEIEVGPAPWHLTSDFFHNN